MISASDLPVGTALAAADGQAGQGVLEDLLKAEELDDAGINVLLEAQAALVRSDRAVELAAIADVGVICAIVVHPDHAEGKHTLRLDNAAQQISLLILGMLINHRGKRGEHFLNGLNKFGLIAVLLANGFDDALNIGIHVHSYSLNY